LCSIFYAAIDSSSLLGASVTYTYDFDLDSDPVDVANNVIRVRTNDAVSRVRLLLRAELLPSAGKVRVYLNGKQVFKGELEQDCNLLQRTWAESGDPFRAYSAELTLDARQRTAELGH